MTKAQARYVSWVMLLWAILAHVMQTADYGWNIAPASVGEWFCDAQLLVNLTVAVWLRRYANSK